MISYKTIRVDPDQWTMLSGKAKHEVELPFAEKDLDLWVEWRASEDMTLWLYFGDGKQMPYAHGLSGHCSIRTRNVISLVLTCSKNTVITVCVSYKDLSLNESKTDWTPVEIIPPDPVQLKLAEAVRKELARMGVLTGPDEAVDLEEEDNLEEDDEPDEFGAGYMQEEVPVARKPRGRAAGPATEPRPGNDAGGGDDLAGGSDNGGDHPRE